MKTPTEGDIERCVSIAFNDVCNDVENWNNKVAGTPKYSWSEPGDVHKPVKFSHREWTIGTLYELLENGFALDAHVLYKVQRLTHSDKITSD